MRGNIKYWFILLSIPFLSLLTARSAYAGPDDFQLTLRNIVQTAPNRLEFDIYILDTDPADDFYLSTEQFGILFNSSIYSGGSITATINNSTSGLGIFQIIYQTPQIDTDPAYPGQSLIKLAGNMAYIPLGQCTLISKSSPGTLVTHFILTSTNPFAAGTTPDFVFTSSGAMNPFYSTNVTVSDGIQVRGLTVTPGVNATIDGNPVLNPPLPTAFNVTGGGEYCEGGSGVLVGLSGSETGVTYTLRRNGVDLTPTVAGTGSAISFGNQTVAGTYTVRGTNAHGTIDMNGDAIVSVRPTPAPTVTGTVTVCQNSPSRLLTITNPHAIPISVTYNINGANEVTVNIGAASTWSYTVSTGTAGTFTLNLVSAAYQTAPDCLSPVTGSATVTVSQTPSVGDQTASINSGQTFTVTPTGVPAGTTYTWPVPAYTGGVTGGQAQATGSPNISGTLSIPSGTGTATYTVTPTAGSCAGNTFTVTVTVTSTCVPVTITSHPSNASICAGESASFSIAAAGTTPTYQWQYSSNGVTWANVANGTPAGAVYTNATTTTLGVAGVTAAGAHQYRCVATNCGGGTTAQSNAATLTVNAVPTAPVVGTITQPTCAVATGSVVLSGLPSGSWTITRMPGGQTNTGTGSSTTISGITQGTYTFTVTSSAGCISPPSASVTINAQPPTPSVGDQTASINSGQTFTVTPTGVPAGTTYTWPVPAYTGGVTGGQAQATGSSNIFGTLSIPSGTGSAIYTVTPTTGSCVGNTFTVTVTVTSTCVPVTITSHPSNASICAGESASFSITASGTTPTYQWQYSSNGVTWANVANGTPAGAVYTKATTTTLGVAGVTAAGAHQYRCVATNCSGSTTAQSNAATLTVNANPPQPVITASGPLAICQGDNVTLTSSEAASYLWSTSETTRSITVSTAGNYTVRVTNAAGCQSLPSGTAAVTINPLPSRPTITPSGTVNICGGSSQTLTASSGTSYLWSTGETTQSITVISSGSYTVQVTNSFGCISQPSLATTVNINPIPATPTITPSGSVAICAGESVTLTSSASSAYLWSNGITTRSITVSAAGNYSVRVTDANGCQSLPSAATAVTVNPLPTAPVTGAVTQPTCTVSTGSVELSGLPSGNWTVTRNPGGQTIAGTGSSVTVAGLPQGSFNFTVTNQNGCTSAPSGTVVINAPPAVPTAPVTGTVTQPTCTVATGSVGISGLPSAGTWSLTRTPGNVTVTGTGTTYTVSDLPSGTYTFTVTNAAGCVSPASGSVTINAPPPVPAVPVQTVDCSLGFNRAVVTVTSPTGTGLQYRLNSGSWQDSNVFSDVANGNHTITVRNSAGCTSAGQQFNVNCGCVNPPILTLSATSGSTCGINPVTVSGNTFGGSATSVTITENGGGSVTPTSSSSSPFSFTYTPAASDAGRTVTITVTTNNPLGSPCAAASATYTLTVNANPAAPARGVVTHPTCNLPTGSVVLNGLSSSGDWTITRSPGGQTTTGSGTSTTITGLAPGTYTFTVTNALGCTSAPSASVVINAQPDTPAAPLIGTITQPTCALSTGSVAVSGLPAMGTWTLTRMPGNVSISASGATRNIANIPPGTYTFTVTNQAGCVSPPSEEFVINAQPVTPSAPVIGTRTHPTCDLATGSIVLENLPENGEWTLFRYPGGTSSTGTGTSATISSLAPGTYNFAVRNSDGCTSAVSANAVINAQPPTPNPPTIGTITHPTFQVGTGSVVLTGLPSSGTWTLIRHPDGFTSQGTGTTRTVSGLEPGTYTFAVTNSFGCTSALTPDVVINARPGAPVVVINNPPTICDNQTTDLTAPAVTAGSDANLTFTYWTNSEATVEYATPTAAREGTYYIRGTSTAGYYTIRPVVVTADRMPVANAGPDQELNYIFSTTLNADIPAIGTGVWALVSGAGDLENSASASTEVHRLAVGDNIFRWTVTNGVCEPAVDEVTVRVNNLTIPTLITPNNDGRNDYFVIRGMEETLGRTELTIFDRRGMRVWQSLNYENDWDGRDYNSNPLPEDTYFYVLRAANGVSISGYIVIRR